MMRDRLLMAGLTLLAVAFAPVNASAQGKAPRTPDGKPSLEGTFNFSTITPLQRPEALSGKTTLSADEAAAFEAAENTRLNRDLFDPIKGQPSAGYPGRADGGVLSYNEFWYERGSQLTGDKRTSLIVEPANGRVPFKEEVRRKNAEVGRKMYLGFADSYEDRTLADRCLMGFNAGPPMTPGAYNNNLQIVQTPGYVMILNEMVHTARIIPIDGRPHGTLRRWSGDSRGHWEGETLVVDTINFRGETSLSGSTQDTKLVERFTRVDNETIKYEFTVSDSNSYIHPWSAMFPLTRTDELVFEYACHEGNYGMAGVLSGHRSEEKKAAEEAAKKKQ
jgi:hypothetical protein